MRKVRHFTTDLKALFNSKFIFTFILKILSCVSCVFVQGCKNFILGHERMQVAITFKSIDFFGLKGK